MSGAEEIAAGLTAAQREALATLPLPRDANPVYLIAKRSYSDTCRKSAHHANAMRDLERMGAVERKVSHGETLWRLTKHLGWPIVRAHLKGEG